MLVEQVRLQAVVSPDHPLATLGRAAQADDLAPHVQLVRSDPVDSGSPDYGLAGERHSTPPDGFGDLLRISANVTGDFGSVTDSEPMLCCAGKIV